MNQFVIAVHCGAGYHSTRDEPKLCDAMRKALTEASELALSATASAEAVCAT